MTECLSGLVYGVNAQVCDLISAGQAYSHTNSASTALHQIQGFARSGTLRVDSIKSHVVEGVPVEVWLMIEQVMIDGAVVEARLEMVNRVADPDDIEDESHTRAEQLVKDGHVGKSSPMLIDHFRFEVKSERDEDWASTLFNPTWIDKALDDDDDDVSDSAFDWFHADSSTGLEDQNLTDLLATFGLYLPFQRIINGCCGDDLSSHTTPIAAILTKGSSTTLQTTSELMCEWEDDSTSSACLDISRSAFKLRPGIDTNLRRLLCMYHITTHDVSHGVVLVSSKGGSGRKRRAHKKASNPRWMVVTKVVCDPGS